MKADTSKVSEIFNRGRNLEIPFFQRSYVWDSEQWQRFLDDMRTVSKANNQYFLGSIILKQQEKSSNKNEMLTVIDGQQRLTTLNIFLKVFCLKKQMDSAFTEVFKKYESEEIILLHNHNNEESFNRVVDLKDLVTIENIPENDKILGAYKFFSANITDDDLNGGLEFYNIIRNIMFVGIDLFKEEDEQQIFDTINSLGVRLTTAELLKNYFFGRDEIDRYTTYWKDIFEKDDDTKIYWDKEITTGRLRRTFIDLFFYSYLQIKIQDKKLEVRNDDKKDYSRVENLFESYKGFISKYPVTKDEILSEIKEYATIFKNNFKYDTIDRELTNEFGIDRINAIIFGLESSTLIPYVLFILRNLKDIDEKEKLFDVLESYIMRRMVVKATTKNYNQLFTDRLIANKVISKDSFLDYLKGSDNKINAIPTDLELKVGFETSVLINKQSAGIIYFIESKTRNKKKQATQLLGLSKYSLEHLMPKKWTNHWGTLPDNTAIENRDFKLKTLGNLAIITQSLNASIRDSDWITKKDGKPNKQGLKHFSGGIETLSPYLQLTDWNEAEIDKRCGHLYSKACEVWSI